MKKSKKILALETIEVKSFVIDMHSKNLAMRGGMDIICTSFQGCDTQPNGVVSC